jgi:hypothetical protein
MHSANNLHPSPPIAFLSLSPLSWICRSRDSNPSSLTFSFPTPPRERDSRERGSYKQQSIGVSIESNSKYEGEEEKGAKLASTSLAAGTSIFDVSDSSDDENHGERKIGVHAAPEKKSESTSSRSRASRLRDSVEEARYFS